MLCFYRGYARGDRRWYIGVGIGTGLGLLAKGPVGLVLPMAVSLTFLAWERQLARLLDVRWLLGGVVCVLVAGPRYGAVAADTKGEWLWGFLYRHNVERALEPMENHRGSPLYYVVVLLVGFGLWGAFPGLGGAGARHAVCAPRTGHGRSSAVRFLLCWVGVYLVFFTVVRTKLPNYVLPLYPALAAPAGRRPGRLAAQRGRAAGLVPVPEPGGHGPGGPPRLRRAGYRGRGLRAGRAARRASIPAWSVWPGWACCRSWGRRRPGY